MYHKIIKSHITESEAKRYEYLNPGYHVKTLDCLLVEFEQGTTTTYIIFEGPWTKPYMCRDCGSHYEISVGNEILKLPVNLYDASEVIKHE